MPCLNVFPKLQAHALLSKTCSWIVPGEGMLCSSKTFDELSCKTWGGGEWILESEARAQMVMRQPYMRALPYIYICMYMYVYMCIYMFIAKDSVAPKRFDILIVRSVTLKWNDVAWLPLCLCCVALSHQQSSKLDSLCGWVRMLSNACRSKRIAQSFHPAALPNPYLPYPKKCHYPNDCWIRMPLDKLRANSWWISGSLHTETMCFPQEREIIRLIILQDWPVSWFRADILLRTSVSLVEQIDGSTTMRV